MREKRYLSYEGSLFVKRHEGLRLTAYDDGTGVWTIGYGQTGDKIKEGSRITLADAEQLFAGHATGIDRLLNKIVEVPLTQGQHDALFSFIYNVGSGAFKRSTLLRKLNANDYLGAGEEFQRWVFAGGRILRGLEIRRAEEEQMFWQK